MANQETLLSDVDVLLSKDAIEMELKNTLEPYSGFNPIILGNGIKTLSDGNLKADIPALLLLFIR